MAHLPSPHRLVVCFLVAIGLVVATSTAEEAQPPRLSLRELAAVGAQAPGCAPGTTGQTIGDAPRLDAAGNVSWAVTLRDPDGGFAQALYRWLGGPAELVFQSGDPAPGNSAPFTLFPYAPQTPLINGGGLTFAANIEDPEVVSRDGLWSDRFGGFERLLLTGDHLPGMPAGTELAGFSASIRGDLVLARASFAEGSSLPRANEGLWRNRTGPWELVMIRGMRAPGLDGAVFDADPTSAYGPLFFHTARGDGSVLAQAWVRGRGIDGNNDEALWIETGSGLQMLVREGARAGGKGKTTFGPASSTPTFGADGENLAPAINDLGWVVFGAILRSGKTRWNSVWAKRGGSLELVARGGLPLSGYGEGDPAPGLPAGATFAAFDGSALNQDGTFAFQGWADEHGNFFALTEAIWWDAPGTLALVAAAGRPVPGASGAAYGELTLEGLTGEDVLHFTASLTGSGVTWANDVALLRATPDGTVALLLREGDVVEVLDGAGRSTLRTVASFTFGPGVVTAGRAAARVTFTDGSGGVYLIDPFL
ncbi:MAG TPA: choice-of-anchor tandem repeat NxxGxxAF-containing protein [Thermoanaerobaculia bacterium]